MTVSPAPIEIRIFIRYNVGKKSEDVLLDPYLVGTMVGGYYLVRVDGMLLRLSGLTLTLTNLTSEKEKNPS